jgi:hypothetical protein
MRSTDLESMRVESNNVVVKNKNGGRRAPARKVGGEAVGWSPDCGVNFIYPIITYVTFWIP